MNASKQPELVEEAAVAAIVYDGRPAIRSRSLRRTKSADGNLAEHIEHLTFSDIESAIQFGKDFLKICEQLKAGEALVQVEEVTES